MHRREFCRRAAAVAAVGSVAAPVQAADPDADPYGPKPEFVTLAFDEDVLERYRPLLVTRTLDIEPTRVYGWVATSTERETAVACYWYWRVAQEGVARADSHVPDREPVYVEFDPDTGDVVRVLYDGYHYLVGQTTTPPLTDQRQVQLRGVNPWLFFRTTAEQGVTDTPLADMREIYPSWIRNGWAVDRESVVVPWRVAERGHWWADTAGISFNKLLWETSLTLGFSGADQSDL